MNYILFIRLPDDDKSDRNMYVIRHNYKCVFFGLLCMLQSWVHGRLTHKLNTGMYLGKKIFQRKIGSSVTCIFHLILEELSEQLNNKQTWGNDLICGLELLFWIFTKSQAMRLQINTKTIPHNFVIGLSLSTYNGRVKFSLVLLKNQCIKALPVIHRLM